VAAYLPLTAQRLVLVTGKGGVGKSAVTAALARALAGAGKRVLAVEIGRGRLGSLLGAPTALGADPVAAGRGVQAVVIEPEEALGDFILGVLRLRLLAKRLLESTSFQVLAAAAPGLPELVVLHRLVGFLDARRLGRRQWDVVVVDAPASGHSLPLLSAPRALGAFARLGAVGALLGDMERRLADPATTLVGVVTTPEELAIRETIELHRAVAGLGLPVAPPIVNALPPRRFAPGDAAAIARLAASGVRHPWLDAAQFQLARRRAASTQLRTLRRALGAPVRLPLLAAGPEAPGGIEMLAGALAKAAGMAA
jgi:anion-transporting  ArsA/GET3 family ATPase